MLKRNTCSGPQKKKKGQSTVEYIVLVAGVIAAILIFVPNTFRNALNTTLNSTTNTMTNMAGRINIPNK